MCGGPGWGHPESQQHRPPPVLVQEWAPAPRGWSWSFLTGPFSKAPGCGWTPRLSACPVPSPAVGASQPGGRSPDVALIKQSFSFVRSLQW